MALRDSGPRRSREKPQQPALFICAPYPSQSEVHPRDGEDPDDSGKFSWQVRVENDPATDVKGRQALGGTQERKQEAQHFPQSPRLWETSTLHNEFLFLACYREPSPCQSTSLQLTVRHMDFIRTSIIHRLSRKWLLGFQINTSDALVESDPTTGWEKGDLIHTLQCFHG